MDWRKKKGGGAGAAAALVPALQPSTGDNILAHWKLEVVGPPNDVSGFDSAPGGLYPASTIDAFSTVPDVIPGRGAWFVNQRIVRGPTASAALQALTPMSLVARVSQVGEPSGAPIDFQYAYSVGSFADVTEAGNVVFSLVLTRSAGQQLLTYFYQQGPTKTSRVITSTLACPIDSLPHVLSCCRSDTDVTFGVDGVYETAPLPNGPPTGGTNGSVSLGMDESNASKWYGVLTDVAVFSAKLTEAQVTARAARMLGRAL